MRKILTQLAIAAALTGAAWAQAPAETGSVLVTIEGLKPGGAVMVGVYASAGDYAASRTSTGARVAVTTAAVSTRIEGLKPGTYAIQFFHDRDGDGKLKQGLLGIPAEPYGFSNNAPPAMGRPKWDAVKFEVKAGGAVAQTLKAR